MEHTIATYQELTKIPVQENGELFAVVNLFHDQLLSEYKKDDMKPYFYGQIIVRESVAQRLAEAEKQLQLSNPNLTLFVVYGYRTHEIQTQYFEHEKKIVQKEFPELSGVALCEKIHSRVAVPEVAGHPTGGAIDISLFNTNTNTFIDMGGEIADYSNDLYPTYSDGLTKAQRAYRKLLHDILIEQNFCPFYGEWWHFSYGDREWAHFFQHPKAIYEHVSLSDVRIINKKNYNRL